MSEGSKNVNNPATAENFVFSSPEGRKFYRQILSKRLPFEPHDFQLEGICKILDKVDVLAVVATGMGKTALFFMFIMVAQEIAKHPSICPSKKVPENPSMVVVCPTNALEEEMVRVSFILMNICLLALIVCSVCSPGT
jgi:superfamily II DNA/RNA helicase